jgi:hypothetical protein
MHVTLREADLGLVLGTVMSCFAIASSKYTNCELQKSATHEVSQRDSESVTSSCGTHLTSVTPSRMRDIIIFC